MRFGVGIKIFLEGLVIQKKMNTQLDGLGRLFFILFVACFLMSGMYAPLVVLADGSKNIQDSSDEFWNNSIQLLNKNFHDRTHVSSLPAFSYRQEFLLEYGASLRAMFKLSGKKQNPWPSRAKSKLMRKRIYKENRQFWNRIYSISFELTDKNRNVPDSASFELFDRVNDFVRGHKIAGIAAAPEYQPKDSNLGYCYGRSLMVHLFLTWLEIPQEHIFKVLHSGNLQFGSQSWNYHIATVVWTPTLGFVVIDPLFEKALPIRIWVKRNQQFMRNKYMTDSLFHFVEGRHYNFYESKYRLDLLKLGEVKRYFSDLGRDLRVNKKKHLLALAL